MSIKKRYLLIIVVTVSLCSGQPADNFLIIDQHADTAPGHLKQSISELVNYLVRPAQNDMQRVRAIFRWISQNIDYDVNSFLERRLISEEPEQVIQRGSAVCGGYAQLFKRMCREININCEMIPGWSKGYAEELSIQPNHAWNAVYINGRWWLLDVTWGSGYINDQHNYIKSFQEHYFFTDPGLMIYDHFPQDSKWQLLDPPFARSTFENLILLRPHFFTTGLKLLSHKESRIAASNELVVKMTAPESTHINAELIQNSQALADHYVFSQRWHDEYHINVHFPDDGNYILRVYSKEGSVEKLYHWACDYNVSVTGNAKRNPFVKSYASFYDLNGYLFDPLDYYLATDNEQSFRISVDQALELALLINGKNVVPMLREGTVWTAKIKPAAGPLRIMAKTDSTNQYQFLLEYEVE